jgi:hypothetical protein
MANKQRLKQLEKTHAPKQGEKITVIWDDKDGQGATIDGTHYTRHEADKQAAELSRQGVTVLHVIYDKEPKAK